MADRNYQKSNDLAHAMDQWRIFPRVFISVYIYMFYNVANWFMTLPEPNNAQAGLVSVVVGAGAAWFGLYVNSTGKGVETVKYNEKVVKSTKRKQLNEDQIG